MNEERTRTRSHLLHVLLVQNLRPRDDSTRSAMKHRARLIDGAGVAEGDEEAALAAVLGH